MSGWIKFEKDLLTDPRVLRVAKELSKRFRLYTSDSDRPVSICNDHALPAVTLVCGALARLWVLADTHIGSDNVLPLGCDELNDILGISGLCELLPEDWLVVIDDEHVQLPEFHEHNGTEARKKAVTQKRVARHRDRLKPNSVTHRNAQALPDQDQDQDQTKTIQKDDAPVIVVFDHWRVVHGHEKAKLDAKRTKLIREALKLYPADDLKRCISGYKLSTWHQGKNDRKQIFDDIGLFLRDAKHIDDGIKLADGKGSAQEWM